VLAQASATDDPSGLGRPVHNVRTKGFDLSVAVSTYAPAPGSRFEVAGRCGGDVLTMAALAVIFRRSLRGRYVTCPSPSCSLGPAAARSVVSVAALAAVLMPRLSGEPLGG
jgi:hypothetical protein